MHIVIKLSSLRVSLWNLRKQAQAYDQMVPNAVEMNNTILDAIRNA